MCPGYEQIADKVLVSGAHSPATDATASLSLVLTQRGPLHVAEVTEGNRHLFVGDAIARGARAVVVEDLIDCGSATRVQVADCRAALARLAAILGCLARGACAGSAPGARSGGPKARSGGLPGPIRRKRSAENHPEISTAKRPGAPPGAQQNVQDIMLPIYFARSGVILPAKRGGDHMIPHVLPAKQILDPDKTCQITRSLTFSQPISRSLTSGQTFPG